MDENVDLSRIGKKRRIDARGEGGQIIVFCTKGADLVHCGRTNCQNEYFFVKKVPK